MVEVYTCLVDYYCIHLSKTNVIDAPFLQQYSAAVLNSMTWLRTAPVGHCIAEKELV